MNTILAIDTTQRVASVALVGGPEGKPAAATGAAAGADGLFALIDGLVKDFGAVPDAVAVCSGPGSLTGRRIGTAAARGIGDGLRVPVIEISVFDCLGRCAGAGVLAAGIGAGKAEYLVRGESAAETVRLGDLPALIRASDRLWALTPDLAADLGFGAEGVPGRVTVPAGPMAVLAGLEARLRIVGA